MHLENKIVQPIPEINVPYLRKQMWCQVTPQGVTEFLKFIISERNQTVDKTDEAKLRSAEWD